MFQNKKIIVVTPAGRKPYLELLIPQIYKFKNVVDEYHLWVNTCNKEDIEYMKQQEKKYDGFIKIIYNEIPIRGTKSIFNFFKNCTDESTVYVRFDDDIIWLDSENQFKEFLNFRIKNPQYFLVYANILNNAIVTHLQQRMENLSLNKIAGYACLDDIGWKSGDFAINLHENILNEKNFSKFRFKNPWKLFYHERVSINAISWLGSEFAKFQGVVGEEEEQWLSVDKPKKDNMCNVIFGEFVVIHYAFYTQRQSLDKTNILSRYKQIL